MSTERTLCVANCQFAVGPDVRANGRSMRRLLARARSGGAELVHFPECALSGYAGVDFHSLDGYDWAALAQETAALCDEARRHGMWVVFGSMHYLDATHPPTNCLYVLAPDGTLVERYDKRFCTTGEHRYFTPGTHLGLFEAKGVRCGLLICYDVRFPELYRAYVRAGVDLVLHSFYNARKTGPDILTVIMRQSAQVMAATNHVWVSAANASGHYQTWAGAVIRPDGSIEVSHRRNRSGCAIATVDLSREYYDASGPYRARAMDGVLQSVTPADHPRRADRRTF